MTDSRLREIAAKKLAEARGMFPQYAAETDAFVLAMMVSRQETMLTDYDRALETNSALTARVSTLEADLDRLRLGRRM